MLLFLGGSARLRPETPDLTIRLVLQDRVLTATTRRPLSDTALVVDRDDSSVTGQDGRFVTVMLPVVPAWAPDWVGVGSESGSDRNRPSSTMDLVAFVTAWHAGWRWQREWPTRNRPSQDVPLPRSALKLPASAWPTSLA